MGTCGYGAKKLHFRVLPGCGFSGRFKKSRGAAWGERRLPVIESAAKPVLLTDRVVIVRGQLLCPVFPDPCRPTRNGFLTY
ncbi:MAG TPA: hypothetical protein DCF44_03765 [Chitinophagaceae bacterium]|nr:hypothetical protein [Chitinophagaceae bacterium]